MDPNASNKDVTDRRSVNEAVETTLLSGRVRLLQAAKGYRIGMDGALLAAACAGVVAERGSWQSALELGCGVGGALLSLGWRAPELEITGLERDADAAALARQNIGLNGAGGRHTLIEGDIGAGFKALGLPRFDLVFSNPPYFDDPDLLRAPHELKRPAWIADDGLLAWLEFAQSAVRDGGEIVFIHRADRLGDLLSGLSNKCGSFQVLPIHPFADQAAKRVIVRAKRLGKAPLKLLPALNLHDGGERKHTDTVEAILRGDAPLGWT